MKKPKIKKPFYSLSFVIVLLIGCGGPDPEPPITKNDKDDTKKEEEVITPCNLDSNSCLGINGEKLTLGRAFCGEKSALYGNYGIKASGPQCDLRVDFKKAPETGKYITTYNPTTFDWKSTDCMLSGTFGGVFSYHYIASAYDTVYVYKLDEDVYHVDFCKASFSTSQSSIEFDSKGSMTVKK